MKTTITTILAAALAIGCMACGDAMDEPISPEARSAQELNLQNAKFERVRPQLEQCYDCYEVILMHKSESEDDEDDGEGTRFDKKRIDRAPSAFDGDPVPWPLDEKRGD
jgi:hypothetical protein